MKKILICLLLCFYSLFCFAQLTIHLNNWKFMNGDSLAWVLPDYNDTNWKPIKVGSYWQANGYDIPSGYAWYRIKFTLSSDLKKKADLDSLLISLGKIDDCDQTFINGKLLGQNAILISGTDNIPIKNLWELKWARSITRNYTLSINDPRLQWDRENLLAVRVLNMFGMGGLYTSPVNIRMKNKTDYLLFDFDTIGLERKPDGMLSKTLVVQNNSSFSDIKGKLILEITDLKTQKTLTIKVYDVHLGENDKQYYTISFKGDLSQRMKIDCSFVESNTNYKVNHTQNLPYILTPKSSENPKINGAKIVGVGTGSDFIFRIPATGIRPITFYAENLPVGLSLDINSGIITGNVKQPGEYTVKLTAENKLGKVSRNLKIVVGNRIALTPPMGWNSWNGLGYDVSEDKIYNATDVLVSSGLADHGYRYVNTDIGWEPMQRDSVEPVVPNHKFPDMKAMTDYIHSCGLQAGIYISAGPTACSVNGTPLGIGSYGHNESDAQTFANWGFDYLKYDWCSYPAKDYSRKSLQKPFIMMKDALNRTGRDFVYSLGGLNSWEWGDSIGGNLWRVVSDIEDNWESVKKGFNLEVTAPYARPGSWNDPDMLVLGWGWYGDDIERLHPSHLTPDEQYSHIGLWALLSAPLLIGCDLSKLDDFTFNLLANDEVIDIDQDPLGRQALPAVKNGDYIIMVKDLEDGSKAAGLFNLTKDNLKIEVPWEILKIIGKQNIRDIWRQRDLGVFDNKFESEVPPHGVVLVKISN